jgi:AcrR family transcriptional regulator
MPKAFTQHEKEVIGKRLLEQGTRMFSAHGLRKTNIEEIANAAGISKGAFYIFYESKEALFMDVIEEAEKRVRKDILEVIDLPGPSPRARLFAVLKKAFNLFEAIPLLHIFNGSDFDLLIRRIPAEKLQEHLTSDQAFLNEMITHCQKAGIPFRATPEQIRELLYPLVPSILHENNWGQINFSANIDPLLELIAAFCLGEVELQLQKPTGPRRTKKNRT